MRQAEKVETLRGINWSKRPNVKNVSARSMPSLGERMVGVAHHPMEIQPWPQTPYPGGTRSLNRDRGHCLVAKEEATARSSVIGAEGVTAAMVRREPVQHGAGSVAFAKARITTRQSVGRLPKDASRRRSPAQVPESQGRGKSPGKNGRKAKAKQRSLHVVFKTVPSAKGIVSRSGRNSFSIPNSVTSEPSVPLSTAAQHGETSVLSGGNIQSKASLQYPQCVLL